MDDFLANSTRIFNSIKELRSIIAQLEELIALKQTSVLVEEKEAALDRKIDTLDNNFNKICDTVKGEIEAVQHDTETIQKNQTASKEDIDLRNLHTRKYYQELSSAVYMYRNLKNEYKNKEKDLLKRALQIVSPKTSESELDKIVESQDSDITMSKAFATGTGSGQQMLKQAKYRRKKIDGIVESVNRLVALIDEIDKIVNKDTKVVDDIVVNVTEAEMNTKQANKELETALKTQRRLNMIKRIVWGIIAILVIGVLIYIATQFNTSTTVYNLGPNPNNNNNTGNTNTGTG